MRVKEGFPPWILTNWEVTSICSDVSPSIRKESRKLNAVDFYLCECQGDVGLAKAFGLKGKVLPVFPNAGGFDLEVV